MLFVFGFRFLRPKITLTFLDNVVDSAGNDAQYTAVRPTVYPEVASGEARGCLGEGMSVHARTHERLSFTPLIPVNNFLLLGVMCFCCNFLHRSVMHTSYLGVKLH